MRPLKQSYALAAILAVVVSMGSLSAYWSSQRNEAARAKGFTDAADQLKAKEAGFGGNPAGWKKMLAEDTENRRTQFATLAEATAGALLVRRRLKDPDSLKIERAMHMDAGAYCYMFRSKNSFNAVVPGQAVVVQGAAVLEGDPGFARLWDGQCVGLGTEIADIAPAMNKLGN